MSVDDEWFHHARPVKLFDVPVRLVPPEEVIWSKAYVQKRNRFDGADILHIVRKQGPSLDWERLFQRMDSDWEVLAAHLLTFQFVYPSQRQDVPVWLVEQFAQRLQQQLSLPEGKEPICRGPLLAPDDYSVDVEEWGYREK